ncbi:hypothetical protein MIND_01251400 [Mycena indigotica]|uniref:Uncharacterized protein n=1 Tax=Mycena indigotica TaxID=2126181 RepID=A0A8H6S6K1_9AGAR|nr:uncharacterized protein MIND_01251400 [Mycena indigotica]KAF7292240.1 hypothetical protein MIND_01251400 [Mycena indigotica]
MPSLEYLVVHAPFDGVENIITRSKLTALRGLGVSPASNELASVLDIAATQPRLAHLDVKSLNAARDPGCLPFIRALALSSPPTTGDRCLRLETLSLDIGIPTQTQSNAIVALLKSRTKTAVSRATGPAVVSPLAGADVGPLGRATVTVALRAVKRRGIALWLLDIAKSSGDGRAVVREQGMKLE